LEDSNMRKMGLFWFAAALLGAALIFSGCETEAETETKYVAGEMIYLDIEVDDEDGLRAALALEGDLAIGFTGSNISLTEALTIRPGKLVYILNTATLKTTSDYGLTVEGIVYVGIGGTLDTSAGTVIVKEGGSVSVLPVKSAAAITAGVLPGTLVIKAAADVSYDPTASPVVTALGSNDVRILGVLKYASTATAFANAAALTTPFNYVGNGGTLDITLATVTAADKPSDWLNAIPAGKKLKATVIAGANEDAATTSLTIPAGLELTAKSGDTLATLTSLTVNGTFTTDAGTLEAVTALTVNGTLTASDAVGADAGIAITVGEDGDATVGDIELLKTSTVAAGGVLTTGAVTAFDGSGTTAATLTASAGSTVNGFLFPADATITELGEDAVTISALTIPATTTLTVAAGKTLTVDGTLTVEGTLVLPAATSTVVIPAGGELTATTGTAELLGSSSSTIAGVKLTVAATGSSTATKVKLSGTSPVFILTTEATSGTGDTTPTPIVGKSKWTFTNAAIGGVSPADASTDAAGGTLKAGLGTKLILAGS
jgi:hypothetical protein